LSAATLDTLGSIPTGKRPNRLHFTPDGRWVLVSNIYSGTLEFFDTRTRQLVDRITFPFDSAKVSTSAVGRTGPSAAPEGILIAPDGKRAWVALAAMDQIAEVDLVTRKVTRYIQTGREPDGMGYVP